MSLGEFGGVDVDLDNPPYRRELLPGESGLLQPQPGADGHHQVRLLNEDVGGPLPPGIRATGVPGVFGRHPVAPFQVVISGMPAAVVCAPRARTAPRLTPPPIRMTGRSDSRTKATTCSTSAAGTSGSAAASGIATGSWPGNGGAACASRHTSRRRVLAGGAAVEDSVENLVTSNRPFNANRAFGDALHQIHAVDFLEASWRTAPRLRSLLLTCPPTTSSSRLSSQAPAMPVSALVMPDPPSPGPARGRCPRRGRR